MFYFVLANGFILCSNSYFLFLFSFRVSEKEIVYCFIRLPFHLKGVLLFLTYFCFVSLRALHDLSFGGRFNSFC